MVPTLSARARDGTVGIGRALRTTREGSPPDPRVQFSPVKKNRDRLLAGEIAQAFFTAVLAAAHADDLVSPEHFTVDGTLIKAWAGQTRFQRDPAKRGDDDGPPPPAAPTHRRKFFPPDDPRRNPIVNFHGEHRSNTTHTSTTDPETRLAKKAAGQEAKLAFHGHLIMEHRSGLAVVAQVAPATGTAERDFALGVAHAIPGRQERITLGGDKGYDARAAVAGLCAQGMPPHVAQHETDRRSSAIDARRTRHPGYAVRQRKRKRIEEIFGWFKTIRLMRPTPKRRPRGLDVYLRHRRLPSGADSESHRGPMGGAWSIGVGVAPPMGAPRRHAPRAGADFIDDNHPAHPNPHDFITLLHPGRSNLAGARRVR
jgi:hypothetical protein